MTKLLRFLFKAALWVFGIAAVVAAVFQIFWVDMAVVGHNAMAPTLVAGDRVLMWRDPTVEMGDILICAHPSRPGEFVMGRVVGKTGMQIDTNRGQLRIAGTTVDRDFRGTYSFMDTTLGRPEQMRYGIEKMGNTDHAFFERERSRFEIRPREVRKGIFLLSDNRTYPQQDSRVFGDVDPSTCIGEVFMRLIPSKEQSMPEGLQHGYADILD